MAKRQKIHHSKKIWSNFFLEWQFSLLVWFPTIKTKWNYGKIRKWDKSPNFIMIICSIINRTLISFQSWWWPLIFLELGWRDTRCQGWRLKDLFLQILLNNCLHFSLCLWSRSFLCLTYELFPWNSTDRFFYEYLISEFCWYTYRLMNDTMVFHRLNVSTQRVVLP